MKLNLISQNVELFLRGTGDASCLKCHHLTGVMWPVGHIPESSWIQTSDLGDSCRSSESLLKAKVPLVSDWPLNWWETKLTEEDVVKYSIITLYDCLKGSQIWTLYCFKEYEVGSYWVTEWKDILPKDKHSELSVIYMGLEFYLWLSTWAPKDCFIWV